MQLVADQVADCGIELEPTVRSHDDFDIGLNWPLKFPGENWPWDLQLSGIVGTPDPATDEELFGCDSQVSLENPYAANVMGYCDRRPTPPSSVLEQPTTSVSALACISCTRES